MKKLFSIKKDYINARLDRWIKRNVCNIPQSLIEKDIRKGKIKVNNKKEKSSYKLKIDDKIELFNFNYAEDKNKKIKYKYVPTKRDLSYSSSLFIENNENFAVINKPSGISVQSGTKSIRNIIDILRNTKEFQGYFPYPVHRIDKETTGVLLVAKNRKYAQLLTSLFRIRKIHKIYLGIILGQPEVNKGTFIDILFHYEGAKKIETKAITDYEVIDSSKNYTLIKLIPKTGRKHQLRKQLFIRNHPIFGDSKYSDPKKKIKEKNNFMLHAYKISFSINDIEYNFSAEPPLNFRNLLKKKYLKIF